MFGNNEFDVRSSVSSFFALLCPDMACFRLVAGIELDRRQSSFVLGGAV